MTLGYHFPRFQRRWPGPSSVSRAIALLILVSGATTSAVAAELRVHVTDRSEQAVEDVVIYAVANEPPPPATSRLTAVMNQMNQEFVPHILVVRRGTFVSFPNNDSVRHHVYSFSKPKPFELSLYAGTEHPPLEFDEPGVVVLGCNIHDNMLGYIFVVDTPYFAKSSASGDAVLGDLPAGTYTIHAWTPRLREADLPAPVGLTLEHDDSARLDVKLEKRLFPGHGVEGKGLNWSSY